MSCLNYIKVKSNSSAGLEFAYVPCGKCPDCRKRIQSDWKFRLLAGLTFFKNKGWNLAFCTLTYRDSCLPYLPDACFKERSSYVPIRCFSREDISQWICNVRHWLKYHYRFVGDKSLFYFVCSEFGSLTKRPHYHAVLAWPPECSYERMHQICSFYWNSGFLFPRHAFGDKGMFSFEIVGDYTKVLNYVSKYVCKDLDFYSQLENLNVVRTSKLFKGCLPFHAQSKSFGFRFFSNLSDEDKLKLLCYGCSFVGNDEGGKLNKLPLYIRNKFLFDNLYVVKKGKRKCLRIPSDFFLKNKDFIFCLRRTECEKMFFESRNVEYYVSRGVEKNIAEGFADAIVHYVERIAGSARLDFTGCRYIAQLYLDYFGVPYEFCEVVTSQDEAVSQWFKRFCDTPNQRPIIDKVLYSDLQAFFNLYLGTNHFCDLIQMYKDSQSDALFRRITDYFNNVLKPLL